MKDGELRKVDVCVVGAGAAGVAAAAVASAAGAEVLCIEKHSFPGGNATAAAVGTICGIYPRGTVDLLESEFLYSFVPRVQQYSRSEAIIHKKGISFLPYTIPAFTRSCYDVLPDKVLLTETVVTDVVMSDDCIQTVTCVSDGKSIVVEPASVIDASGNAVVSRLAGIPCLEDEQHQAAALVFALSGLPPLDDRGLFVLLLKTLESAVRDGRLSAEDARISIVPGSVRQGTAMLKRACPYKGQLDVEKRSRLECRARSGILAVFQALQDAKDFDACSLSWIASTLGVRSGFRGAGQAVLAESDVVHAVQSPDELVRGVWPLEYWSHARRPEMIYFPEDTHYSITAAMLQSRYCSNLFFAGRTMSGTERALGSARVLGTAMLTGEAVAKLVLEARISGRLA